MDAVAAARSWLRERHADVPDTLLARMEQAVNDVARNGAGGAGSAGSDADGDAGIHRVLAAASIACLREAIPDCDARDAALPLLAADALMTAAFEAATALADPVDALAAMRALADEYDAHRIAARAGVPG